jgi:hypothetical protein
VQKAKAFFFGGGGGKKTTFENQGIRANDRKNQENPGGFTRIFVKFRLFHYDPP